MTTVEVETDGQKKEAAARSAQAGHPPLFEERETNELRTRWQNIQGGFVDDPHASVEQADQLVTNAIQRLAEVFSSQRSNLEATWSKNGEVTTEDMRQALRRYRAFFDQILSI